MFEGRVPPVMKAGTTYARLVLGLGVALITTGAAGSARAQSWTWDGKLRMGGHHHR